MVEVIIKNKINNMEAYLEIAKRFVADASCDAGCYDMHLLIQPEDKEHVTFISRWEQSSDFEAHCAGSVFKKYIPLMAPYYEGGTDTFYEVIE